MDNLSNNLTKSTTSLKPSFKGGTNENEMKSDMVVKLKGVKKNLPAKNYMSTTISAANKKKILMERNENSAPVKQRGIVSSSSFGSKVAKCSVVGDVDGEVGLKPYDPVKNYSSPRPKFFKCNPNRRRKILKENDESSVRDSTNISINAGCGSESGMGSLGTTTYSNPKRCRKILKENDEGSVRHSSNSSINVCCGLESGMGSLGTTDSNQNRRRKVLKENDESNVRNSTHSFINAGCGLESGMGSLGTTDCSSHKESLERVNNVLDKEGKTDDVVGGEMGSLGTTDSNPKRCRKILKENDERSVRNSTSSLINAGCGLESGMGSLGFTDSSSQKESLGRVNNVLDKESKIDNVIGDEIKDDDEEVIEYEEEKFWSLKGLLKWSLVVIALVLMTQVIYSMNSPMVSHTVGPFGDFSNWSFVDRAAGLSFSEAEESINMVIGFKDRDYVFGAVSVDYSNIGSGPTRDADVEIDDVDFSQDVRVQLDEVVNDETDVIEDYMWSKQQDTDHLQRVDMLQEHDTAETEMKETDEVEVKKEVTDQLLKKGIGDLNNTQLAISDPAVTVLTGLLILLLTSLGALYHSKGWKSTPVITAVQKEDLMEAEPSANTSSLLQQKEKNTKSVTSLAEQKEDVFKEKRHINAPSVKLLGEFVFGEEVTSSVRSYMSPEDDASNSLIQTTTVSSHTSSKPRHKAAESSSRVKPSQLRRSNRILSPSVCVICR